MHPRKDYSVSTIVKAHSWTGEVVDAKSNKFYRVYSVGPYTVTQYGAQGSGRTGGSFAFSKEAGDIQAINAARAARGKKRQYDTVHEIDFDVDLDRLVQALQGGDKKGGEFLDNIHTAMSAQQGKDVNVGLANANVRHKQEKTGNLSTVPSSTTSTTQPQTAATGADRLTAFGDRALAALTLSTTDVRAATQAFADLSEELEGLQDEFRKAQSFLGTLELMVTEALTK